MADGGVQHKLVEILCANVTEIYEGGIHQCNTNAH